MKKLFKKYETFIKYIFSAGISFLIDLTLFKTFVVLLNIVEFKYSIIIGTIVARIISSFINYRINRNTVFKVGKDGRKMDKVSLIKYVSLVIIQMFVSAFSVNYLYNLLKIEEILIKIPVEGILFIVNFFIQKLFIFNTKEKLKKAYKWFIYDYKFFFKRILQQT